MEQTDKPVAPSPAAIAPAKAEKKLSKESAEITINGWLHYYEIEFEDIVNDQGKEGAQTIKNKLIRAVCGSRLEIKEDSEKGFQIVQHLKNGKSLTYAELSGKHMIEGEKAKGQISGLYAMLGSLCGLGSDAIISLKASDLGLAHAIGTIFLVV